MDAADKFDQAKPGQPARDMQMAFLPAYFWLIRFGGFNGPGSVF